MFSCHDFLSKSNDLHVFLHVSLHVSCHDSLSNDFHVSLYDFLSNNLHVSLHDSLLKDNAKVKNRKIFYI